MPTDSTFVIASRDNPRFKTWTQLLSARGLKRHGLAIVSGRKIVPELAGQDGVQTVLYTDGMERLDGLPDGVGAVSLPRELFAVLDDLGTDFPLLIKQVDPLPVWTGEPEAGLSIAIAAQDPANLGSILRSAVAFGAARAVLLEECAHPYLPRVTRAAAGANFSVPLVRGPSIDTIPDWAVALDKGGDALAAADMPADMLLLLGEEGAGVPMSFRGRKITIPHAKQIESLNVAVAAGIAMAEYRRRHPAQTR